VRRLPGGAHRLVVDPACGDGALLAAIADQDPATELAGFDIDDRAVTAAQKRLGRARIVRAEGLTYPWTAPAGPISGVIANPPWGADLVHDREQLADAGYLLANGQFDSYELFLERAVDQLPAGGVGGFLVPDSLLLPEHAALRQLLVNRTRLELLVRLGEGIFDGVYRGAVAVVFLAGAPPPEQVVRCCRVRDAERREVLTGTATLSDVVHRQGHDVPQAHFSGPGASIDVDTTEAERTTLARMYSPPTVWARWLRAFRGVEIGKLGRVTVCSRCQFARPAPGQSYPERACRSCGAVVDTVTIVRPLGVRSCSPDWHPVLAGEDVQRYAMTCRREIQLGVRGIRYKDPAIFVPPKLLVRKTGVGLHATLDGTGALTTQTIFHFLPTSTAPRFALHYVLGVLNSRILLAYHLKRHGDMEWRSHPYVTPKLLAALPVPLPGPGTQSWRQAVAIADAARLMLVAPPHERHAADLHVERLVAALFHFQEAECRWVDEVLGQAQQLRAIAALRLLSTDELYPLDVR
jgi:hypothetical protein